MVNNDSLNRPIFVVGTPRSGNTLVAALLDKHPDFFILWEKNVYLYFYRKWLRRNQLDSAPLRHFVNLAEKHHGLMYSEHGIDLHQTMEAIPAESDWSTMLSHSYSALMSAAKPTAKFWGDKTPSNVAYLREIIATFPHAPNNPVINAVVVSNFHKLYCRQKCFVFQENLFEIRYSTIVANTEILARALCDFLEVPFVPQMLGSASIETRKILKWEEDKAWNSITPQKIAPIISGTEVDALLEDVIDDSGYEAPPKVSFYSRLKSSFKVFPFRAAGFIFSLTRLSQLRGIFELEGA